MTDEQWLEYLLRHATNEILHVAAFQGGTIQSQGKWVLIDPVNKLRKLAEAAATKPLLERIAALEAKLAQRVPDGWPTNEMIEAGRKAADSHGPLLGNGQSLWHIFRDMLSAASAAPEQQEPKRCPYCDDTGDVHRIDGEWRGMCHCPAGVAINAQAKPSTDSIVQAAVVRALDEANVRDAVLRGMCIEVALEKARDILEWSK